MSRWLGLGSVLGMALALTACGGFSPEEAKERCDQERDSRDAGGTPCVDDAAYDSCISAYEDCGDDVVVNDDACPVHYSCDEEDTEQEEG